MSRLSLSRRDLMGLTLAAALYPSPRGRSRRHRWFPKFPVAETIWKIPFAGPDDAEILFESAAGLAAHAALNSGWRTLLWESIDNSSYVRLLNGYLKANPVHVEALSLDDAIRRLHEAGIVKGYLLYRIDPAKRDRNEGVPENTSANVATSLAPLLGGVAASEQLAPRMDALGLKCIEDLRERDESWCLDNYGERFTRRAVGTFDPRSSCGRSLVVAMGAFACSGGGPVYSRALSRCEPDSPVIGWGCGAEDGQTLPSTKWGLFQTATNWCLNLTVTGSDSVPEARLAQRRVLRWQDLDWGENRHHAAYVLTDGDNVQWVMGNFNGGTEGSSYYANLLRGSAPFGWGLPAPSLAQLSPRTLAEILEGATPNDDFVLYNPAGYYYPDMYGSARPGVSSMALEGDRLRAYLDLTRIRILVYNFQRWDSPEAMAACEALATRLPGLLGILAFQYYPYSAGNGAIRWVRGANGDSVPVVSCRCCIWAQTGRKRDTTPAGVAGQLSKLPTARGAASDDCFSFVLAHAWSRFRQVDTGAPLDAEERGVDQNREAPDTRRGYEPALWSIRRLAPSVRPVTPQELLWRIRLRLRTHETLARCLSELEAKAASRDPGHAVRAELGSIRAALDRRDSEVTDGRLFERLRRAGNAGG